jgi:hypothetical protein
VKGCMAAVLLSLLALCSSVFAIDFGINLGTRTVGLWPVGQDSPEIVRGGAGDLLASVPLSSVLGVNFRAGGFTSTSQLTTRQRVSNLFGLDGRVAIVATASIVKDAVSAYVGVGATYEWSRSWGSSVTEYSQRGITIGVPAGLRLRLSRRLTACVEMEVPDYGSYRTESKVAGLRASAQTWSQYGSMEPNVSAALYLVH